MSYEKGLPHRSIGNQRRQRRLEQLEPRLALDGTGAMIGTDAYLTLSFAPDGTDVVGHANVLHSTFNGVANENVWQDAILQAFQSWAVHTNSDIGLVGDSGDPLGTPGATQDDDRFGDIRVSAIPMAPEVGALSVSIDTTISGTWYADVIFNSAFPYQSVDDVFAIALHEAGNVFGLEDNNDPNSPLMAGPIPTATTPTANDIANLQALHGARRPDFNEFDDDDELETNDNFELATELNFGKTEFGVEGSAPFLAYGDIQNTSDVDYFSFDVPDDYTGQLTIEVLTEGISLLKPKVTLYDSFGVIRASAYGTESGGNLVQLQWNDHSGEGYFLKVESAANDVYGIGGYSVVGVLDGLNAVSQAEIAAAADGSLRFVESDDLEEVFDASEDFFNDDLGGNDTISTATPLRSIFGFENSTRFETIGSISVRGDQDFFRVTSPSLETTDVMYVAIRSLDIGELIPEAEVYDSNRQALPARVLVNGAGEYLIEILGIAPESELFVRVRAARDSGPFVTGNYALAVSFSDTEIQLDSFATGSLPDSNSQNLHTFHVAEPQLFHFVPEAEPRPGEELAAVVTEIVDAQGTVRHQLAAQPGTSHSAGAVYLPIGSYTVRVAVRTLQETLLTDVGYSLQGTGFTDPFVGEGQDPTTNPFVCEDPGLEGFYCYPGEYVSPNPYLWDDFTNTLPEPPPELPLDEVVNMLVGDWWSWVWNMDPNNGPPLALDDSFTSTFTNQPNAATTSLNVLSNDVDPENEPMAALLVTSPTNGSLTLHSDGTFEYRPNPGFVGQDSFTYAAYDFRQESVPATVNLTVTIPTSLNGDYDGNGVVSGSDFMIWLRQLGSATETAADGNNNGVVDGADLGVWRANFGTQSPPPVLEGDFNHNGRVAGSDFLMWQRALGSTTPTPTDGNNDGVVDGTDLGVWQTNYGTSNAVPTASVTIPVAAMAPTNFVAFDTAAPVVVESSPTSSVVDSASQSVNFQPQIGRATAATDRAAHDLSKTLDHTKAAVEEQLARVTSRGIARQFPGQRRPLDATVHDLAIERIELDWREKGLEEPFSDSWAKLR